MNIESTALLTKSKQTSDVSSTSSASSKDASVSFKNELDSAKSQDTKQTEANPNQKTTEAENNSTTSKPNQKAVDETAKSVQQNPETDINSKEAAVINAANIQNIQNIQNTQDAQETQSLAAEASAPQKGQTQAGTVNNKKTATDKNVSKAVVEESLTELTSQIATLNVLKSGSETNSQKQVNSKTTEKTYDKSAYCQTMKMDSNDAMFFVNLVNNQQMTAQTAQQASNFNGVANNFSEIKSEATQQTVQVSATLMDAINNSVQTGKPFRIDFDNNIAVVMKVDKDGVLSANFIPGSAAVENYLRNNIEGLRQSFDNQNLPYNELSYSSNRQKQEQQEKNKKENKNE